MVCFDNYYTQDTDVMINITLLCIENTMAVINFVRFVMDKKFILKFSKIYRSIISDKYYTAICFLRFVLSFILYRIV